MKVRKFIYVFAAGLTVMLLAVCAYAAANNQLSYVERFATGKVDIDIQELSVRENGETAETEHIVEANKDVSYIPRIINNNAACFVRAHVEVVMDGECNQPLNTEHIYGMNSDWICRGDYFYYTKELEENRHTEIFEGIHIPEDWDYGNAEGFSISVTAEAVQSANFKPDFNKELPWGAVELNNVETATGGMCAEAVPVTVISDAEYVSGGGFQCSTADLFDGFDGMMPGSKCEKTVNLKNSSEGTLKVSLKVSAGDSELNRKLQLRITAGSKEIYSGTAASCSGMDSLDIMEIARDKTGSVKLELSLAADADNGYIQMQDDIVWTLQAEEVPDESVKTSDASDMLPYAAAMLMALIMMMCAAGYKRKGKNETDH